MQRTFTFSHCKENRTKGRDCSVLPANKSKLCPGSTSGKYQLEVNTKLYYFPSAWGKVSLTNSDRGEVEGRIRKT